MIQYIRSLRWADYLFYVLTDPRKLMKTIETSESRIIPGGIFIVLFSALFEILTVSLLGAETQYFYYKVTYGVIFLFLIYIIEILMISSLVDLFCQFSGYGGKIRGILNLVCLAQFPRLLLLPAVYIFKVFHFAPVFFYALFSIMLLLWTALIAVQGISEMHGMIFSRAFLVYLFPFAFYGLVSFLLTMLIMVSFFGYFS